MPINDASLLPASAELLTRQVHPSQITEGRPSARSFTPTEKDAGHLSADRESLLSPREAYERYLQRKQLNEGGGTWGVSIQEFANLGLTSYADPISDNSAHTLVDFTSAGDAKKQQTVGKLAFAKAKARGRLHPPPDLAAQHKTADS
jgi:hypothetical protein